MIYYLCVLGGVILGFWLGFSISENQKKYPPC